MFENKTVRIIFFATIILMLFSFFSGLTIDVTRDAGKYATISKEIFQNKNYINLTVHGDAYDQKPPMLFWLGALGFIIGHIGDSRTYCLRNGQLEQLTQDHTLVQQQLEAGLITRDKIKQHPLRNVIFRCLGRTKDIEIDLLEGEAHPDDLFLLCSDGLTDMVPDVQIHDILCSGIDIHHKVEELIEAAKSAGGNDNITVVLAAVY